MKLQLKCGSDLGIINVYTLKKIGKRLLMVTKKITHSIKGQKIEFEGEFII